MPAASAATRAIGAAVPGRSGAGRRAGEFRARNVGGGVDGGEAAAGHQAVSFAGSARAACSSRRQLATSSRLKAA